ncbi:MAG: MobF family relaxase, partial [Cyanobacteria bacterium P01_F01_bin.33]
MMSLSNISAQQGETYYTHENYYCIDEAQPQSEWSGKAAASLGLVGPVDRDRFSHLLNGNAPDGDCLPGRQVHRSRQQETPRKHRAGLDMTFSAPKSVSLAALVNGDRELEMAHRTVVDRTLAHIESHHALTRKWDGRKQQPVRTGNLIVAKFHHDTSRELDPQLHTHCVAINATQLPDGTWRALSNESIYQNAKLLSSIYRNELAHEVRQLGYEIECDRDCLFELKGYRPEQLEYFSERRQQILEFVGGPAANAKERGWAAIRTRASKGKDIPREILHERWSDRAEQIGLTHPVPARDREVVNDVEEARELVDRAVEHCSERSAVFRRTAIQKAVLERIQPFDLATMEAAIAEHPDLIPTLDSRFTTESAREREEATLVLMRAGRNRVQALTDDCEELDSSLEEEELTEGQRAAIRLAAITRDRFIAWQGVAGAGKTTALRRVKQMAEATGSQVQGFAPSASAAQVLGEELGIATTTVASLLLSNQPEESQSPLWIVDEASFLSAKDAHDLLERATRADVRVILVGDVQQLSAVEAGHPFRSLQQGGMATAHLDESLRQHAPDLKAAVDAVARGEVKAGLERLQQFERVVAIADDAARRDRVVNDYIALSPEERSQTLVLAGTHAERTAITEKLRQELKREETLGRESLRLVRLKPKSLTDVQSRFS